MATINKGFSVAKRNHIKADFPDVLKKSLSNVTMACNKLGIDRRTFYAWYKTDPVFAERCDATFEETIDFVESKLMSLVNQENLGAICFFLKNRGRSRGWADEHKDNQQKYVITENDEKIFQNYLQKKINEALLEKEMSPTTIKDASEKPTDTVLSDTKDFDTKPDSGDDSTSS